MANVEAAAATEHFMPISDPSSAVALMSNAHCRHTGGRSEEEDQRALSPAGLFPMG
jgi:hypothetical protein